MEINKLTALFAVTTIGMTAFTAALLYHITVLEHIIASIQ